MAKLSLAVEATGTGSNSGYNSGDKGLVKAAEILDQSCRVIKLASEDAKELCKLTDKLAKGVICYFFNVLSNALCHSSLQIYLLFIQSL